MVEGHQCHRVVRAHRKSLMGRSFAAQSPNGRFADGAKAISGKLLSRIECHGKNLFYFFGTGEDTVVMHVHFGMSGAFRTSTLGEEPDARETTRLKLVGEDICAQLSAMTVAHGGLALYDKLTAKLGPDPLREDADGEVVWARMQASRKPVGLVLMDQSMIAGIGNIYRAEILFKAGVHPEQAANTVERAAFERIWRHSVELLRRGFQSGSILTVDPEEAKRLGKPWTRRYIYNQARCGRCGGEIRTWNMAARTCYACHTCQPLPAATVLAAARAKALAAAAPTKVFKSHCAPEPQADAAPAQLTIAQLKVALRVRGLPLTGRKADLAARLASALAQGAAADAAGEAAADAAEDKGVAAVAKAEASAAVAITANDSVKDEEAEVGDGSQPSDAMPPASIVPGTADLPMASAEAAALEKRRAGEGRDVEHGRAGIEGQATGLQRTLMSWDYWRLADKLAAGSGVVDSLRHVPKSFSSVEEYVAVMEPLVLEECGALLLRGNEDAEIMCSAPAVTSGAAQDQHDGFTAATFVVGDEEYRDNDAVMLSIDNTDEVDEDQVNKALCALGMVEGRMQGVITVRFCLAEDMQSGNPEGAARVRAVREALRGGRREWYLLRLANLSTIMREWSALHALERLSFRGTLLAAAPTQRQAPLTALALPKAMEDVMKTECNESQVKALVAGLDHSPVVLIQGPPGTGKTRTILNLLSVILHAAPPDSAGMGSRAPEAPLTELTWADKKRLWYKASPWLMGYSREDAARPWDPDPPPGDDRYSYGTDEKPVYVGAEKGPKAHVLVCAPSNSALDEIVLRLDKHGLLDRNGTHFKPSLVRVGLKVHHSVAKLALDEIVRQRLKIATTSQGGGGAWQMERMRAAVLEEAHIVACTLSFAGSATFARMSRPFDVVVIDEAAQAVEPAVLVPLVNGCKQVYLVGDPQQLPATVISPRATAHGYNVSLFRRLQANGFPVQVLNQQYRMHPDIAAFPAAEFYDNALLNGEAVQTGTTRSWHDHPCFGPLAFYDVPGRESQPRGSSSLVNKREAEMALALCSRLLERYPHLRTSPAVAVISPYQAQVKLLKQRFQDALGPEGAKMVDISTIDGFQGREKDVVLFSAVRTAAGGRIGFVADERRLNVGLTRARASLLVLGSARALSADVHWDALVRHCSAAGCMYVPQKPFAAYLERVLAGKAGPLDPPLKAEEPLPFQVRAEDRVAAMDLDAELYSEGEEEVMAEAGRLAAKRAAAAAALDAKLKAEPGGELAEPGPALDGGEAAEQGGQRKRGVRGVGVPLALAVGTGHYTAYAVFKTGQAVRKAARHGYRGARSFAPLGQAAVGVALDTALLVGQPLGLAAVEAAVSACSGAAMATAITAKVLLPPLLCCRRARGFWGEPIAPVDMRKVLVQLARALAFLKQRGIVHLDLKPGNVLITDATNGGAWGIKLIDFGFAVMVNRNTHVAVLKRTPGSIDYAYPCQMVNEPFSHEADMYGLSASASHGLTCGPCAGCAPRLASRACRRGCRASTTTCMLSCG
ncbi:hypothetical protein WJX81_004236 [Elliptochloris bilobata]|uniref:DNA-(apurinic or apyrimidinic site) lyase n=1 Tax=Elliptochloris bilobata TaxID=381761 RepID=A0AAW1S8S7_9CHLO